MTPEKDGPVKSEIVAPKAETSPTVVPTVGFEDEVSKNWDYQRQMESFVAKTTSIDKNAVLFIIRDSASKFTVGLQATGTSMKYNEGHSIELKIGEEFRNFRVEPSYGDSVRLKDALDFVQAIKGKKNLEVNVLNEKGPKKYLFNISGLQDFFTTI